MVCDMLHSVSFHRVPTTTTSCTRRVRRNSTPTLNAISMKSMSTLTVYNLQSHCILIAWILLFMFAMNVWSEERSSFVVHVTSYSKEGPWSLFLQIKQNTLSLDDESQWAITFHSRITISGPSFFVVISFIWQNRAISARNAERWNARCSKAQLVST